MIVHESYSKKEQKQIDCSYFSQAAYFLQFHSHLNYIRRLLPHVLERLDHPKQHDQDKFRRNHSKRKYENEYPNSVNARIGRKGNDAQRIKI